MLSEVAQFAPSGCRGAGQVRKQSFANLCHPQHKRETGASALPWLIFEFAYERQAATVAMSAASSFKPDALIPTRELLPIQPCIVGIARSDIELVEWTYIKPNIRPEARRVDENN